MRDPNRIKPLLGRLEKVWSAHPEIRLGQLIMNATNGTTFCDPWNMECESIVANLEKTFLKKLSIAGVIQKAASLYPTQTNVNATDLEDGVITWFQDNSNRYETFIKKENGVVTESYYEFLGRSKEGPWCIKIKSN